MSQGPEVGKPQHTPDSMDQGLSEGALFSLIHSADIYWTVTMCHALETQPGADRLVPAFMGLMVQCERSLKKKKVNRNGHFTTSDAKGCESKIESNGEGGY